MTCDGTAFGREAEAGWAKDELELLELEIAAAKKRAFIEIAKQFKGYTAESIEKYYNDKTLGKVGIQRVEAAVKKAYEDAHDRHFLREVAKNGARLKQGHAHG